MVSSVLKHTHLRRSIADTHRAVNLGMSVSEHSLPVTRGSTGEEDSEPCPWVGGEDLAQLDSYRLKSLSQEEINSRYQLCSDVASISVPATNQRESLHWQKRVRSCKEYCLELWWGNSTQY